MSKSGIFHQQGMTLIMLIFIIGLIATAYLMNVLDANAVKIEQDKKTAAALAEAKAALLAYAAARDLSPGTCTTSCPRPGDLPCPDANNDGSADGPCTSQAQRIGRLPWKTLGLDDLRDGSGERLWYAISMNYKNNTRIRPLNSDTTGTITLRDIAGNIVNDGSSSTGVVAIVFSPGSPIVRQDGTSQTRDASQENITTNYMDTALGEDNADFVDSGTNGFIMGPIKDANGNEILNDRLLAITREDMISVMEARVLGESLNALLDYYCGTGNANYTTKSCVSVGGNRFFPSPALFSDTTCLGYNSDLTGCFPNSTSVTHGRIPANPTPDWSTSILRNNGNGNWFQQNGWRELVHYAVAPACAAGTADCGGVGGLLTLNQALVTPIDTKQVILISTGHTIGAQSRANNTEKSSETNYLESENLTPLDNTYVRTSPLSNSINDRAISLP